MDWDGLLAPGLLIVSGKGGTGKSTVAAALALAGARRGLHVLLAEIEGRGEATRTLGMADPGYEERPTGFGFEAVSINPRDAAFEYLHRHHRMDRLSRPLLRSGVLDQVVRGAPGLRDLLLCGKLYELGRAPGGGAGPPHDLIVVDGPPTGQLVAFLSAPETFVQLVRVGPMRRRAASVATYLRRWGRVVLVAAAEEMSVAETLEAAAALPTTGLPLAAVIADRREPAVFPRGTARAATRLSSDRAAALARGAGLPISTRGSADLLAAAAEGARRQRQQERLIRNLRPAGRVLELPEVLQSEAPERVVALADAIGGVPASAPFAEAPAGRRSAARKPSGPKPRGIQPSLDGELAGGRIVVVCGAGGVGKTTISAAIALHLAESGRRTILLTVDPARRLATALRLPLAAGEPTTVALGRRRFMEALQLDTKRTFDDLVARFAGSGARRDRILGNPFYRRIADTLGGTHEYMAMEKLYQLADEGDHDAIVIDTPPTRSALSLLDAPDRLGEFLSGRLLRLMLWPTARAGRLTAGAARFGARAFFRTAGRLIGAEPLADIVDFLDAFEVLFGGFQERAAKVQTLLRSEACRFVVVAGPTHVSLGEAWAFLERLDEGGMRAAAVVVNRRHPAPLGSVLADNPDGGVEAAAGAARRLDAGDVDARALAAVLRYALHEQRRADRESAALAVLPSVDGGRGPGAARVPVLEVPELAGDVHDVPGLRRVASDLFG